MQRLHNLNPYERHKLIINEYVLNQPGRTKLLQRGELKGKTDIDVIRENHKFLWDDDEVAETWEEQLARKYYDKLFKEYCISDLSRYKENKVALRWRIEKEVVSGKGQFICGNKICNQEEGLRSWEVNFAYMENGEKKNALVKLRLCPICSDKLNYRSKKREVKRMKKQLKKNKKKHKSEDLEINQPKEGSSQEEYGQISECNDLEDENESGTEMNEENTNTAEEEKKTAEEDIWRKPIEIEEPSREEEFEKYLEDLLL